MEYIFKKRNKIHKITIDLYKSSYDFGMMNEHGGWTTQTISRRYMNLAEMENWIGRLCQREIKEGYKLVQQVGESILPKPKEADKIAKAKKPTQKKFKPKKRKR